MYERPLLVLACVVLLAGCGGEPEAERFDVKGTVTFDGQPVAYGTMTFIPKQGDRGGASGNATIENGSFDTSKRGEGVIGGLHRVIVSGFDGKADPDAELPHGQPLFADYETEQEFPAVGEVEVHEVNFDVPNPE